MRKQLSQPSFVNGLARSKGESIRPDLWADNLWCPVLGIQGNMLYDVAGGVNGTLVNMTGDVWLKDRYLSLNFAASNDRYINLGNSILFSTWPALTLELIFRSGAAETQLIFENGTAAPNDSFYFDQESSTKFQFYCRNATYYRYAPSTINYVANTWYHIICTWSPATDIYIYSSGVDITGTRVGTVPTALQNGNSNLQIGARPGTTNYDFTGLVAFARLYKKVLTQSQILDLTADPFLPLRRKKIWSMYVPSGTVFKPFWYRNKNILIGA